MQHPLASRYLIVRDDADAPREPLRLRPAERRQGSGSARADGGQPGPLDVLPGARRRAARRATVPVLRGWVVEERIGAGRQAEAFAVRPAGHEGDRPDGRRFVAKLFRRRAEDGTRWGAEEQQWRLLREVVALRLLESTAGCNTPRVVTFGTCLGPDCPEERPWYVMPHYAAGAMWRDGAEGAPGGWAESYRGNVDRVLEIAAALATTLAAMHDRPRRIVHRDVTAENVFFAQAGGAPVLGDFGAARVDGFAARPTEAVGSDPTRWRPPELGVGLDADLHGPAGDVFMLGGLVYQALSGGRVLPPACHWDGACVHRRPEYTLTQDSDDPRVVAVEALLERMLARDPGYRLPAREIARMCRAIRGLPAGVRDGRAR